MRTGIVAFVAALVALPAAAQEHQMHGGQQGPQQCMAMMGGAPPEMLLHHRDSLKLTPDQVTRLEALRDRADESAQPHMQPAMQAHMAAAELLEGNAPDFAAYETKLREAAEHMILAHTAMARAGVEARQVLTPEQTAKLDAVTTSMMAMHAAQRGAMQQMQPMQGQEHGMAGTMMMHCMMMGAGQHQGGR